MCIGSEKMKKNPETKSIAMDINAVLPQEIIEVMFSKLSIVNLPNLRLVCKAWNDLILDRTSILRFVPNTLFVCTLYLEFPPFLGAQTDDMWPGYLRMRCMDFDEKYLEGMNVVGSFTLDYSRRCPNIRISNSCNGLLCIIKGKNHNRTCAGILNPMTNEYIKLPGYDLSCREENYGKEFEEFYLYGFGFSPKVKQYKVARIFFVRGKSGCVVEIFTLGKSSNWSYVDSLPFVIDNDGVYFNGALYWIGRMEEENKQVLCCLDVDDEKFDTIDLPKVADHVAVDVFNGNLYATFMEREQPCKIEVWWMMQDCGRQKAAWVLGFVVDGIPTTWELGPMGLSWKGPLQLIKTCENGEILCLFDRFYLFLYNLKTRKIRTLVKTQRDERAFWIYQIDSLNFDSLHKILVG